MAAVKRLAAHKARPRRKGDAAGRPKPRRQEKATGGGNEDSTSVQWRASRASKELTSQVEISQDNASQEPVHVELDAAILHVLGDDGLHRAEGQHAGLVDLPPITFIHSPFTFAFFLFIKSKTFTHKANDIF